uniref:Uncharacterized protein n=1 Tax=Arundo donax TaxID=35708 RepID=A0A0A8Z111_ARUDO
MLLPHTFRCSQLALPVRPQMQNSLQSLRLADCNTGLLPTG